MLGPVEAVQAVIPKMHQTGSGQIINMSSVVAKMVIPGIGAYSATKAALNVISEYSTRGVSF